MVQNGRTLKTLTLIWKVFLGLVVVVGVIVGTIAWVDDRVDSAPHFSNERGLMLERRIDRMDTKVDNIRSDQKEILRILGQIEGRMHEVP